MSETKNCVETLQCALTEEEVAGYSQEMADLNQTKVKVDAEKKEVVKEFGARLQKYEAEINVLSLKIITKKEARDVNCYWEFNFDSGEKILFRTDTGEAVKMEVISAIERQRHMEFIESKNEGGEMSQAIKKAENKCPHCGAKDGKEHFSACPNAETPEVEEEPIVEEEELPATQDHPDTVLPEPEDDGPKIGGVCEEPEDEVTEPTSDDGPEDCFGTFASDDSECKECDRKKDCKKETPEPEAKEEAPEKPAEEPEEKTFQYTCKECGGDFDTYNGVGNEEDAETSCPICGTTDFV